MICIPLIISNALSLSHFARNVNSVYDISPHLASFCLYLPLLVVKVTKYGKINYMRLNKYLANITGISRRQADELISQKKVTVSGNIATLGQQVDSNDKIFIDNKEVKDKQIHTTILLNKPLGYLSSRKSQGGDATVYHLLPKKYQNLKTAGRLDKDSSGLMILSSDGDLIQRLTHPKYSKVKVYEVELNKPLEPLHQQMINDFGIDLPDGKSQMTLEKLNNLNKWRVTMKEGRNRQIRRTFGSLGYSVKKLHRTHIGPYSLGILEPGDYREI